MKNIRGFLALLLVLLMFTQSGILSISAVSLDQNGQPTKYSDTYNSGTRFVVANTLNGTGASAYYTGNYQYDTLSKQSSTTILNSLRTLMTNTHKKNSSYDDCWDYADNADCQNEDGKVYLIYTNAQSSYADKNASWNREHVWPKSLGGYETSGPGADLHHIRPSDNKVNSTRNNLKYGNVVGNAKDAVGANGGAGISGGTYNSSFFEPHDNVKGDVARICLYMHVRYGGSWSKCSSITNVFQSIDVLLEWCALDPVDTWELGRNEVVEAYQGNRNVFIDYPEYAWLIFGRSVPENLTSPSRGVNGSTPTNPVPTQPPVTEPATSQPTTPDAPFTGTGTIEFVSANRVSWDGTQQTWKQNGITLVNDKSASNVAVADYTNPARFYANSKLTITVPGMTKLVFNCNTTGYATALKNSIPSSNICTVSVSGKVVTITFSEAVDSFIIDKLSAQVRVDSLAVQAESSTPPATEPPVTEPPVTEPPVTEPPTSEPTEPPTTKPTEPPTTKPTEPSTTEPTEPGAPTPTQPEGSGSDKAEAPSGLLAFFISLINAILAIFGLKLVV